MADEKFYCSRSTASVLKGQWKEEIIPFKITLGGTHGQTTFKKR
jgi:hypothetical protein